MKLDLQLYVRRHRNGFFTVRVLGDRALELYTDDLDQAREDLELVVGDLIDRSHPRRQHAFALAGTTEANILEVPDLFTVHTENEATLVSGEFTAVVSGTSWRNIWLPRLDLHVFVKNKRRAWEDDAAALIHKHLNRLDEGLQLSLRLDAEEWLEVFSVTAEPPPLTKFVGKHRNVDELPLPADEQEEQEESKPVDGKPPRPPTPTLTQIGVNLGDMARNSELERAHERKQPIDDLYAMVSGKRKMAVVVTGPSGVGKTTILNELAHRIAHEKKDPKAARPVFFVDASRLVAGDNWFGDWQRQTLNVLEECENSDVVWFVGNVLALLDAGKNISSEQNVSMLMKPALAGRRIMLVGECSAAAWSQLSLRDAGFARLFTVFRLEEPDADEALRILRRVAHDLERDHGVAVAPEAINAALELSKRYSADSSNLGSSAHLLRRVAEGVAADSSDDKPRVDRSAVVRHFSSETGLPQFLIRDELPLPVATIREAFESRLIGQPQVIGLMTDLISVIKAGLSDLGRPLGSFLFVGPTGVGKTETAKTLARFLFGSAQRITRFDMSEFSGWDAVHRFLGRKDQEGKLVSAVRRRPFSVVLLDEIEKASPAIFDVLLQVLGEARLTDEGGRTADFKNVVVIMTSNLGVDTLKRSVGFDSGSVEERFRAHFIAEAQKFFRPELFNRIDHIVPFLPLGAPAIRAITTREIDKFLVREGLRQRNLTVRLGDEVLQWLADRGVDERYGARPLKRVLERRLTARLARELADGVSEQTRTIVVHPDGDDLSFEAKAGRQKAEDDLAPLLGLIKRVQDLQFRHRSWMSTAVVQEASSKLRLLERLSQSKKFWEDQKMAETRLAGVQTDRALVDNLQDVGQRITSLADLAHDAYFSRDTKTLDDLSTELEEVVAQLATEEMSIHGRGMTTTRAVTLLFTAASGSALFLERLVVCYGELARDKGWSAQLNILRPVYEEETKKLDTAAPKKAKRKKGRKHKEADEHGDDATPPIKKAKKSKKKTLKWLHSGATPLYEEKGHDDSLRRQVGLLLQHCEGDDTVVMFFEGDNACTMLLEESGQHLRIGSNGGMQAVGVRTKTGTDRDEPTPEFLTGPLARIRVVDERQDLVEDALLDMRAPDEPRLWRVYERFMRARPFRKAFGDRGVAWFKAWEER